MQVITVKDRAIDVLKGIDSTFSVTHFQYAALKGERTPKIVVFYGLETHPKKVALLKMNGFPLEGEHVAWLRNGKEVSMMYHKLGHKRPIAALQH